MWQPVETAPKDRRIIIWSEKAQMQMIVNYAETIEGDRHGWVVVEIEGSGKVVLRPEFVTLWQECPANPKAD